MNYPKKSAACLDASFCFGKFLCIGDGVGVKQIYVFVRHVCFGHEV